MLNSVYNHLLWFLSHDWAGLVLAGAVAGLGLSWLAASRTAAASWANVPAFAILGFAALLTLGSVIHLTHMARVAARYPAPGKMVDVGGYRIHLLAEGEARGKPTIVWIPGSHDAGFEFHHLHEMLRGEARSILIDRPGSGWSDIGPFPRTTSIEAGEVVAALRNAGERAPFVFVGHSFGGLLAANIARRHPEIVAGVILLDATPPDALDYSPANPILKQMLRDAATGAVKRLFGIDPAPPSDGIPSFFTQSMRNVHQELRVVESGSRSLCADASIFEELDHGGLGWQTVVYDGDLLDLPVYLVAPADVPLAEVKALAQKMDAMADETDARDPIDVTRLARFYGRVRERYMASSSKTERIYAPPGTGHLFPYERPEFVADVVRRMLREHQSPSH